MSRVRCRDRNRWWSGVRLVEYPITGIGDGSDETASWQAQINAIPDGAASDDPNVVILPSTPVGSSGFRINGVFKTNNRHNLIFTTRPGKRCKIYTDLNGIDMRIQVGHMTNATVSAGTLNKVTSTGAGFTGSMVGDKIWISGAGAGGTNLLATIATFIDANNVTFNPPASTAVSGATIDFGNSNRPHWQINGSTFLTIENVDIVGPNVARTLGDDGYFASSPQDKENESAWSCIAATTDITLNDCTFDSVCGDGVLATGTDTAGRCYRITVNRMTGQFAGRCGFALVNVDGFSATDCSVQWNGQNGVDMEPNGTNQRVDNSSFLRCVMSGHNYVASLTGATAGSKGDMTFDTVSFTGQDDNGREFIHLTNGAGVLTIRNCTATVPTVAPRCINAGGTIGTLVVENNILPSGPGSVGVNIGTTTGATIRNNQFAGASTLASDMGEVGTHCGNVLAGGLFDGVC